jgi:ubiquinone/menaquinone biosynthesis C-methylase UbiE
MLDHFDVIAPLYDRLIKLSVAPELVTVLNLPTGGRLLDAGGGTGRVSGQLTSLADQVVVCDFSQSMLKQAGKKGKLQPVRARVERLPFPDESFERILVVDALHHFVKPQEAIAEFVRVLKPGGRLVIEEFDINRFVVKLIAWGEKLALMGSRFFSPNQIVEMIAHSGLPSQITKNGKTSVWVSADK